MCGGNFNDDYMTNLLPILNVKEFWKTVSIWRCYRHVFDSQCTNVVFCTALYIRLIGETETDLLLFAYHLRELRVDNSWVQFATHQQRSLVVLDVAKICRLRQLDCCRETLMRQKICYGLVTKNHTTTILRPFFQDHPGQPVPEENFWTLWCKGRLTEAYKLTIRLGATPSGLTSANLHHPLFYRPDALPAAQPTASKHWSQVLWLKTATNIRSWLF